MSEQRCRKHKTSSRSRAELGAGPFRESAFEAADADRTSHPPFGSGACRFASRRNCNRLTRSRHFASLDKKVSIFNFVAVLEQAALGRSRGARTVVVIRAAVTGTHEEI